MLLRRLTTPLLALAMAALVPVSSMAEVHHFAVDPVHSQVGFKVRHLVAKTPGRFTEFEGSVWLDPDAIEKTLRIEGTIQAASVYTDNEQRDGHLKSPDFFDVENHPTITIMSKSVKKKSDDTYMVTAEVTMRGVTKTAELMVEYGGVATNPFSGTPTTGLEISGSVNRKDFGMEWNKALDQGGVILGEEVQLDVQLEATVPGEQKS